MSKKLAKYFGLFFSQKYGFGMDDHPRYIVRMEVVSLKRLHNGTWMAYGRDVENPEKPVAHNAANLRFFMSRETMENAIVNAELTDEALQQRIDDLIREQAEAQRQRRVQLDVCFAKGGAIQPSEFDN